MSCVKKRWQLQFDGVATLRITAVWRDVSDVEVEHGVGLLFGDRRHQQEVVLRQPAFEADLVLQLGKSNMFLKAAYCKFWEHNGLMLQRSFLTFDSHYVGHSPLG